MAEPSILQSTKKMIGIDRDYTAFDLDIITHINTAFFSLNQIGVGPVEGFAIEDETASWSPYVAGDSNLNAVKTYIFLRVRMLFDPPETSFTQEAMKEQIKELEWRLNVHSDRDPSLTGVTSTTTVIDGGEL